MKFKSIIIIGLAVVSTGMFACKGKPKLMTPEEVTAMVDSKFSKEKDVIAPELDKLCDAQFPMLVQAQTDTLVNQAKAMMSKPK
jgi:hypothetical protein